MTIRSRPALVCTSILVLAGCRSPYYQDQGTAVGALGGAGVARWWAAPPATRALGRSSARGSAH